MLKIDPQQNTARRMLSELNQHISRRQQIEHVELKRRQAQNAFLERNYEAAASLLQEALKLVPGHAEAAKQLELVLQKQRVAEQVTAALRQAEEAKRGGEISKALAIVEKALSLDTTNARVRMAYNSLIKQVKEAEQRERARQLLELAREQLASRNYDAAFTTIREAELLDPPNSEIQRLTRAAREEVRLQFRRSQLTEIERLIASAADEEDWRAAAAAAAATLEQLPSDPLLLRYTIEIDQQIEQHERARRLTGIVRA